MDEMQNIIQALAEQSGCTVTFHDSPAGETRCDITGKIVWKDAPLPDVEEYFKNPINFDGRLEAYFRTGDDEGKYDAVIGCFDCKGIPGHKPSRAVMLHTNREDGPQWEMIIPGTVQFHDFNSMAVYAAAISGSKPMTQKQYAALREAYHKHLTDKTPLVKVW